MSQDDVRLRDIQGDWWVFYPVTGLQIVEPLDTLQAPLFGDAAIVSKEQVGGFLEQFIMSAGVNDKKADLEFAVNYRLPFTTDFHSQLAVRRKGPLTHSHPLSRKDVRVSADGRARAIAALLTVLMLASNNAGKTCCLEDQMTRGASKKTLALSFDTPGYSFMSGGDDMQGWLYGIFNTKQVIKASRVELESLFQQPPFARLVPIITRRRSAISASLRNIVATSLVRLSESIMSTDSASQLLGAVTAIEILLTHQGEPYQSNGRRLVALLGKEASERMDSDAVFHARHEYVHRGLSLDLHDVAKRALALSMLALFRYSYLAYNFRDKSTLVDYLDFIWYSDKVVDAPALQRPADRFSLHERAGFDIPFLQWALSP